MTKGARKMKLGLMFLILAAALMLPVGLSARELIVKAVDAFTGVPVPGITVKTTIFNGQNPWIAFTRTADDKGEIRLKRREARVR